MLALIIFLLTLLGILTRPFKLKIWVFSSVGAVACIALKLVDLQDLKLIFSLIWDSCLTLIALIIISLCLQALGFFEWLIFAVLKLCQRLKFHAKTAKIQAQNSNLALNSSQNSLSKPTNPQDNKAFNTLFTSQKARDFSQNFTAPQSNTTPNSNAQNLSNSNLTLNLSQTELQRLKFSSLANSAKFVAQRLKFHSTAKANFSAQKPSQPQPSQQKFSQTPLSTPHNAPNTLIISAKALFIALCILCALCSVVLANDGAILILTPLVLGLFLRAKSVDTNAVLAFLFAISFVCDASSNALIISNLTNIITANYFALGFADFAKTMFLPNLLGFLTALALFLLVFRKALRANLTFRAPTTPKLSGKFFAFYLVLLAFFVASFFISREFKLPLSLNCLVFALFLLVILWRKAPKKATAALKNAPFSIIIFVFGLFVVVFALSKLDINEATTALLSTLSQDKFTGIFALASLSALFSSVFNNLPMVLFGDLLLGDFFANLAQNSSGFRLINEPNFKESLIYAHLLGCNIGSKLTPIGSLCTLLWLALLAKKGVNFSLKSYLKFSLLFTFATLFAACFGLRLVC